ncbi:MAG TPA: Gfo/Idh/MocA family oxidoreductase [Verrucomicrobiae bacterium]|nr:Gfo/Idh/MocA family oxidoreductase [Verrucomicrobiae bacterium]
MKTVRLGIIGMGNIGRFHAGNVRAGRVSQCELVAICSRQPAVRADFKTAAAFDDADQLIHSGLVDAVLIATPHWQHSEIGMAALAAGLHVMVEKPVAAHKADAERFITAHQKNSRCVFSVMSQLRAEPRYQAIRELLQSGALGSLVRVSWINTDWFRPEAYYQSSAWRATWRGEGGGVLLNQSLHNLDLLQWLVGMPARVRGFCHFGRFHDIEVEDDVTACLEWADGATGTFVASTGEAPGTNRLEISGTCGRLRLEEDKLWLTENDCDAVAFSRSTDQAFGRPGATTREVPFANAPQPHAVLLQNFVNAILHGEPLMAPGEDGIHAVELANAIVYSSLQDRTVELPLDAAAWAAQLDRLTAGSTAAKKVGRPVAGDVARSFKR